MPANSDFGPPTAARTKAPTYLNPFSPAHLSYVDMRLRCQCIITRFAVQSFIGNNSSRCSDMDKHLSLMQRHRATIAAILPHGMGADFENLSFVRRNDRAQAAGATWDSLIAGAFPPAFTPPLSPTTTLTDVIVAGLQSQRQPGDDDFDVEFTLAHIVRNAEYEVHIMSTLRCERTKLQMRQKEETKARGLSGKIQKEIAVLQKQEATPANDAAIAELTKKFNEQLTKITAARRAVDQAAERVALAEHIFPPAARTVKELLAARGIAPDGTLIAAPATLAQRVLPGGRERKVDLHSLHRLVPAAVDMEQLQPKIVVWERIRRKVTNVMSDFAHLFMDARSHHVDIVTRANDVVEADAFLRLRSPEDAGWSAAETAKVRARLNKALYELYSSCHRGQRVARNILKSGIWGTVSAEYFGGDRNEDPSFFEETNHFFELNERLQHVVEQLYMWMETEQQLILREVALNQIEERFTARELDFLRDIADRHPSPESFEQKFQALLWDFTSLRGYWREFETLSDRAVDTFKLVFEQRGPMAGRGEPLPPAQSKDFGLWNYSFVNHPRNVELRAIQYERERLAAGGAPRNQFAPARAPAPQPAPQPALPAPSQDRPLKRRRLSSDRAIKAQSINRGTRGVDKASRAVRASFRAAAAREELNAIVAGPPSVPPSELLPLHPPPSTGGIVRRGAHPKAGV